MFNVTRSNWCLSSWYSLYVLTLWNLYIYVLFSRLSINKWSWWIMYDPDLLAANIKYKRIISTMSVGHNVLSWSLPFIKCIRRANTSTVKATNLISGKVRSLTPETIKCLIEMIDWFHTCKINAFNGGLNGIWFCEITLTHKFKWSKYASGELGLR